MKIPVDTPQPHTTNVNSLSKQSPLTTISKTVGLDSFYSSMRSFEDRDYRKSYAHFADGLALLTATAALTGLAVFATYTAWRYTKTNNPLDPPVGFIRETPSEGLKKSLANLKAIQNSIKIFSIERKCAKALKVIHPDKSKTSEDAYAIFKDICAKAVMAIKQCPQ